MKTKVIVSAIMAMTLLTGGGAFAQGNGRGNGNGNGNGHRDDNCRGGQKHCNPGQDRHDNNARRSPPSQNQGRPDFNQRHDERGAGPDHAFHKGGRLPIQYRSKQYVVDDWRGHHLSAPPRGYHWVQSGSDYLLVAIATGVILQLLLNN